VRKQVDVLLAKLKLNNREELIAWAVESGYGKLEIEA
jgi:DNA-binding CsgD family transcriptional regulator